MSYRQSGPRIRFMTLTMSQVYAFVCVLESSKLILYIHITTCVFIGLRIYNVCVWVCVCACVSGLKQKAGLICARHSLRKKSCSLCPELIRTVSPCAKPEEFRFTCLYQTINICIICFSVMCRCGSTNQLGTSGNDLF